MDANPFDGIVCFGSVDWWYHNRSHYDLQMMREFSAHVPVLYVNSIGMRPPNLGEGRMFFRRVARKLKSLGRGLARVRENFCVFSPVALPGGGRGAAMRVVGKKALSMQVRLAARRCGIQRPLVWVACPPAATIIDYLKPEYLVYQRTDRFEDFLGVDQARIRSFDRDLKDHADLVLFCSRELFGAEQDQCRDALLVDHGVDFERFEAAGIVADDGGDAPADVADIPRPRVGFVGGIDADTFDPALFVEVARSLPDVQFVMVGGCTLPSGWCSLNNVHLLGQRPYEEVPSYMAACDVLIMPWNHSDWIQACNPVKLKEYLAVGRPVVSTYFPEIEHYRDHITVANGARDFAREIRKAIEAPGDGVPRREFVRAHTWEAKAQIVWRQLGS